MLTLWYRFARGGHMKALSICVAALALHALMSGCQKREPTRPAQPTVSEVKNAPQSAPAQAHCPRAVGGLSQAVRKHHFGLP